MRLVQRMIWFNVADANRKAKRGIVDGNTALRWLWDVGRSWAEITGGQEFKSLVVNLCEEIAITAEKAQAGETYRSELLSRQLKRRDIHHL